MTGSELKQFATQRWGIDHAKRLAFVLRKNPSTVYRMYDMAKINYLVEEKVKQIMASESVK
jgi:hypothetical protein